MGVCSSTLLGPLGAQDVAALLRTKFKAGMQQQCQHAEEHPLRCCHAHPHACLNATFPAHCGADSYEPPGDCILQLVGLGQQGHDAREDGRAHSASLPILAHNAWPNFHFLPLAEHALQGCQGKSRPHAAAGPEPRPKCRATNSGHVWRGLAGSSHPAPWRARPARVQRARASGRLNNRTCNPALLLIFAQQSMTSKHDLLQQSMCIS